MSNPMLRVHQEFEKQIKELTEDLSTESVVQTTFLVAVQIRKVRHKKSFKDVFMLMG